MIELELAKCVSMIYTTILAIMIGGVCTTLTKINKRKVTAFQAKASLNINEIQNRTMLKQLKSPKGKTNG